MTLKVISDSLILVYQGWKSKNQMQPPFAEPQSILHLKFFTNKVMVNLLIGGVLALLSMKWLSVYLLSTPKAELNFLTRSSLPILKSQFLWVTSWEICLSVFSKRNLRIDWELKVPFRLKTILGSQELTGKPCFRKSRRHHSFQI